jgi:hypothetical protein
LKNTPNLTIEATDNRDDISKFISENIDQMRIGCNLKEEIHTTLLDKSEGV